MSDDGSTEAEENAAATDEGIPLAKFESYLAPIRRVTAYAVERPGQARFLETNLRRWLDPLHELDLPAPIREETVGLAGHVAGLDALPSEARQDRLRDMRQVLARLDAVLGLPIPRSDRPRRPRRQRRQRSEAEPKREAKAPPERNKAGKPPRERKGKGRDRKRNRSDKEPSPRERGPRSSRGTSFWKGNPFALLESLSLPSEFVTRMAGNGLTSVLDVLLLRPVDEEVLRPIHGAGRELPTGRVAVGGRLVGRTTRFLGDNTPVHRATLKGAGRLAVHFSDEASARSCFDACPTGDRVVLVGHFEDGVLLDPEPVAEDGKSVRLPKYGLDDVLDTEITALVFRLLPGLGDLRDPLPPALRGGHVDYKSALMALHARGDVKAALARLAHDEALGLALCTGFTRFGSRKGRAVQHAILHRAVDIVSSTIDHRLTDHQERVFDALRRDLRRNRPMQRLLFGPAGGGKGLIALLTAVSVGEGKSQVVVVDATAGASQTRHALAEYALSRTGLRTVRLEPGRAPNKKTREALKRGDIHIVYCTPEHVTSDLAFRRLGLVICASSVLEATMEQLSAKSPHPDVLAVAEIEPSAADLTTTFATFDLSYVQGPPVPDLLVKTISQRDSAYAAARHALNEGGQVAVVFPQIDGKDALDPTEANRVMNAIGEEALSNARMALLHGAMTYAQQVEALLDFNHRRAQALVSTVLLEELPAIPGLEIAVIEHAHRMDPARLQRLSGMHVRQLSLVVADDTPEEDKQRLIEQVSGSDPEQTLAASTRFLEERPSGEMLASVRQVAFDVLASDPTLRSGASSDLVRFCRSRWGVWFAGEPCPLPEPGESPGHGGGQAKRRRRRRRRR